MTTEDSLSTQIDMIEDRWWTFYLENPPTIDAVQPIVRDLCSQGCEVVNIHDSAPYFRILFLDPGGGHYELSNSSDDVTTFLFLGTHEDRFYPPESSSVQLESRRFIGYGLTCHGALPTVYSTTCDLNEFVEPEAVMRHLLTHIVWAQIFGAMFVQSVGEDLLANAPGWRNERLGDGSRLYMVSATPPSYAEPGPNWRAAYHYFLRHVGPGLRWPDMLVR